jgi:hypothetical protein
VEFSEALLGIDPASDSAMILLDDVVSSMGRVDADTGGEARLPL